MKTKLIIFFLIIVLLAVWAKDIVQAQTVNIYLSALSQGPYYVGNNFKVAVMLNVQNQEAVAFNAVINFDSSKLEMVGSKADETGSVFGSLLVNSVSGGKIHLTGISFSKLSGNNLLLATIEFKAKAEGTAQVSFAAVGYGDELCYVSSVLADNILSSAVGANYGISADSTLRNKELKIKITPEGRKNLISLPVHLKVLKKNQTVSIFDKYNLLDSQGFYRELVDLSSYSEEEWDIAAEAVYYLTKKATVVLNSSKTTETEIKLLAGNLQDKDNVINELDWDVMGSKWFTGNPRADINQDGEVNSLDWHYLNKNWGVQGD